MAPEVTAIEARNSVTDRGCRDRPAQLQPGVRTWRVTERKAVRATDSHGRGITGEYVGGNSPGGPDQHVRGLPRRQNPLERESTGRRSNEPCANLRPDGDGTDRHRAVGLRRQNYYDAPIHELLGTYRTKFPAYASTYHGDGNGGLETPGLRRLRRGVSRDGLRRLQDPRLGRQRGIARPRPRIEAALALGERVGDEMDLMCDPACELETFADALKLGRALDEAGFYWYGDPTATAVSPNTATINSHRSSTRRSSRPRHVRGLEPATDFMANRATDFMRADPVRRRHHRCHETREGRRRVRPRRGVPRTRPGPASLHLQPSGTPTTTNSRWSTPTARTPSRPSTRGDYSDMIDTIGGERDGQKYPSPGLGVDYDWDYIGDNATGSVHVYE